MQILDLFKREISVGNVGQNIGFYVVLAVLLFITYFQFKEANRQKRLSESYPEGFEEGNWQA